MVKRFAFWSLVRVGLVCAALVLLACGKKHKKDEILAVVGDRVITTDEFIRRAEYTIRPDFCKTDSYIHKKIVLNSLIAEKLFSLEAGEGNALAKNPVFQAYVRGRTEQAMRQILYQEMAMKKVRLDTTEIKNRYRIAGREYNIAYYSIDQIQALRVQEQQVRSSDGSYFEDLYRQVAGLGAVPERKVSWQAKEDPVIHRVLFGEPLKKGQVLGPIPVDENQYLMVKVLGWIDRPVITETEIRQRWQDVTDELKKEKADGFWDRYVLDLMKGKKLDFDKDMFWRMVDHYLPIYFVPDKEKQEMINNAYWKNDQMALDDSENPFVKDPSLMDKPFFTMDGKTWTVRDFEKALNSHPLVFRKKKMGKGEFPKQFKYAVADLLRDTYLNREAHKKGLDGLPVVRDVAFQWHDALMAGFQRTEYLKSRNVKDSFSTDWRKIIANELNPYADSLFKKYSDRIQVNIPNFESVQLTRIDMVVRHEGQAYTTAVPSFPLLTTRNRMDYGRKLE